MPASPADSVSILAAPELPAAPNAASATGSAAVAVERSEEYLSAAGVNPSIGSVAHALSHTFDELTRRRGTRIYALMREDPVIASGLETLQLAMLGAGLRI